MGKIYYFLMEGQATCMQRVNKPIDDQAYPQFPDTPAL
jgi:hypothetical protein